MNNKLLYYFFSRGYLLKLKRNINKKRNYINNDLKEKNDFIFDDYRNKVIKKMMELFELKRILRKKKFLNKNFKKNSFFKNRFLRNKWLKNRFLRNRWLKNRIFKKFHANALAERIRNELLLATPVLLYLHKRRKSWRSFGRKWEFIDKSKIKNKYLFWKTFKNKRKFIRNFKILPIGRSPTYREAFDLRIRLKKMHFWLINTTKRQILNVTKLNKLRYTRNNFKNYIYLKKRFVNKKFFFFKKRRKFRLKFLKNKRLYLKKINNFYFDFLKKLMIFNSFLSNKTFYKFYLLEFMKRYLYYVKKTVIFKLLKGNLINSLKELKLKLKSKLKTRLKRKKFKIRRRIKRKLLFFYNLSKYKNRIYKLKVRMVKSNFFITLTDCFNNVIVSRSTGQVSDNRKKKVKLSPYLVTKMMYSILRKLKKLKIKFLYFFINTKINRHINNVMKMFQNFRYTKILRIFFSKPIAHHFGTRKPKLRRL